MRHSGELRRIRIVGIAGNRPALYALNGLVHREKAGTALPKISLEIAASVPRGSSCADATPRAHLSLEIEECNFPSAAPSRAEACHGGWLHKPGPHVADGRPAATIPISPGRRRAGFPGRRGRRRACTTSRSGRRTSCGTRRAGGGPAAVRRPTNDEAKATTTAAYAHSALDNAVPSGALLCPQNEESCAARIRNISRGPRSSPQARWKIRTRLGTTLRKPCLRD